MVPRAIDVHAHLALAESHPEEVTANLERYFKTDLRTATDDSAADLYRRLEVQAVIFMIDFETALGVPYLGNERVAAAGIAIAWLASAVAIFDWVENIALATILLDEPASPWPAVALGAAIPKFAGTWVALLYALGGGAVSLAARGRRARA